jgi:hypothetical protein
MLKVPLLPFVVQNSMIQTLYVAVVEWLQSAHSAIPTVLVVGGIKLK